MEKDKILKSLCYYDKRNPNNNLEFLDIEGIYLEKDCDCDNCFYDKTELANELLKYINNEKT